MNSTLLAGNGDRLRVPREVIGSHWGSAHRAASALGEHLGVPVPDALLLMRARALSTNTPSHSSPPASPGTRQAGTTTEHGLLRPTRQRNRGNSRSAAGEGPWESGQLQRQDEEFTARAGCVRIPARTGTEDMTPHHFAAANDPSAQHLALDITGMNTTITCAQRALAARPPQAQEMLLLAHLLRGHLALLLAEVLPRLNTMDRGTTRWDQHNADYDAARHTLHTTPADDRPGAAALRLRDLAHACEQLLALHLALPHEPGRRPRPGPR
ncbi:DUF6415 family natural product biosynthesis protein [Streptomyces sp. NPDC004111]|uniref:DUF6415 family natural product biosynthesis protein n=1 Tax=Streptomyces sp. NPDC004111 TaxID=3364690 RepID=UPI00369EC930